MILTKPDEFLTAHGSEIYGTFMLIIFYFLVYHVIQIYPKCIVRILTTSERMAYDVQGSKDD